MEYTKDIILDIGCKRQMGITKFKKWTTKIKKGVKDNRIIIVTLSLLITLISIDFILVNSFMKLLTSLY